MNALLDTNILIDYLNGIDAAREEIARYPKPCISPMTWMEVMVGAEPDEAPLVGQFLARFAPRLTPKSPAPRWPSAASTASACPMPSSGPAPATRACCWSPATAAIFRETTPACVSRTGYDRD